MSCRYQDAECMIYCWYNHFFKKKFKDFQDKPDSHYLLNGYRGGVLGVPGHATDTFNTKYATDIVNHVPYYISECRTLVHKQYFDLDLIGPAAEKEADIMAYCQTMQEGIAKFFVGRNPEELHSLLQCVILRNNPVPRTSDTGEALIKTGAHVIFPNLHVDRQRAAYVHHTCLALLQRRFPRRKPQESWEKVLDAMTYLGHGLRMVGSFKRVPCPVCKNRPPRKAMCDNCRGYGTICPRNPYVLCAVLRGDGEIDRNALELLQNFHRVVKKTSIRLPADTPLSEGWDVYPGAPIVALDQVLGKRKRGRYVHNEFSMDQQAVGRLQKKIEVPLDGEMVPAVQKFLRDGKMGKRYSSLNVKKMFVRPLVKKKIYIVQITGDYNTYCQNKDDHHRTNSIYFEISVKGMSQRCFCRCPVVRKKWGVKCQDYWSAPVALPDEMQMLMFPESFVQHRRKRHCTTEKDAQQALIESVYADCEAVFEKTGGVE